MIQSSYLKAEYRQQSQATICTNKHVSICKYVGVEECIKNLHTCIQSFTNNHMVALLQACTMGNLCTNFHFFSMYMYLRY